MNRPTLARPATITPTHSSRMYTVIAAPHTMRIKSAPYTARSSELRRVTASVWLLKSCTGKMVDEKWTEWLERRGIAARKRMVTTMMTLEANAVRSSARPEKTAKA